MKPFLSRDIPSRAAAAIIALALVASVVTGREEASLPAQPVEVHPPARETPPGATAKELPARETAASDLDLQKLNRLHNTEPIANLFAPKIPVPAVLSSAAAAAASAPPPPPPAPTAPQLPFRYLGKIIDGEKLTVFLARGDEYFSVATGDTVDGAYRIESIDENAVNFIYTPLGSKQSLPVTSPN